MPTVLREKGYHVYAIQEAHVEQMQQLEPIRNFVLEEGQRIAVRLPHEVGRIAHRSTKKVSWLVAEISFQQPRLGLRSRVVMSIHVSCKYAKRAVAGP